MTTSGRNWDPFALLLIDLQEDFWSQEKAQLYPDFPANITSLLETCRSEGIEVVHVRASFQPDGSDWMPNHRLLGRIPCIAGTEGVKTLPFATEGGEETVIIKRTYDGFLCPDLHPYLQKRGKRFLFTAGLVTSICVLLTTLSATQLGFLTAVVEDCCADEPTAHERSLDWYQFVFNRTTVPGMLKDYDKWMAALEKLDQGLL